LTHTLPSCVSLSACAKDKPFLWAALAKDSGSHATKHSKGTASTNFGEHSISLLQVTARSSKNRQGSVVGVLHALFKLFLRLERVEGYLVA